MYNNHNDSFSSIETTCGLLLLELQKIWDDVGENDVQRDKMLFQIEQKCLEVYKKKVDEANERRTELQSQIALAEKEIESICSALGELPFEVEQKANVNLKEKSQIISPLLVEMRKRKAERKKQYFDILNEVQSISKEIFGPTEDNRREMVLDGADLSLKRLEELQNQLLELKTKKSNRSKQVVGLLDTLNSLCMVLGMEFKHQIHNIHPTLDGVKECKDITDETIARLTTTIQNLQEVKIQRMKTLRDLGTVLLNLWNLMETPTEEQQMFLNITSNITSSESEITEPNLLSVDLINHVEDEVRRLKQLKSCKVKELALKKRLELEEICRSAHMITEALSEAEYSVEAATSGDKDPGHVLEEIELQIANVKEEAWSRKEILDKMEKWLAACEEESWLEEYNRDDNRYNAGRGTHLTLKRAEKARAVFNKIPAMVETLTTKILAWEKERGIQFLYDGEPLLFRLEQYNHRRKEKEQEKIRQRDQKKLQVQLMAEQEVLFGAKPSPKSGKKGSRTSIGVTSDRKLSLGGAMLQNLKAEKSSARIHPNKKGDCLNQNMFLGYQQYGGLASQTSRRRSSEIAGHSVKKQYSAKTRQSESRLIREPLSPIPLSMSSKANIANFREDHKGMQDEIFDQTSISRIKKLVTPTKPIPGKDDENRTPKTLPVPVPTTPTTTSAPMLMASTPATPHLSSSAKKPKSSLQQIEYSFEEVRAGFSCPDPQLQSVNHTITSLISLRLL